MAQTTVRITVTMALAREMATTTITTMLEMEVPLEIMARRTILKPL